MKSILRSNDCACSPSRRDSSLIKHQTLQHHMGAFRTSDPGSERQMNSATTLHPHRKPRVADTGNRTRSGKVECPSLHHWTTYASNSAEFAKADNGLSSAPFLQEASWHQAVLKRQVCH